MKFKSIFMSILMLSVLMLSGCTSTAPTEAPAKEPVGCSYITENVSIEGCYVVSDYMQRIYDKEDANAERECKYFCDDVRYGLEENVEEYDGAYGFRNQCYDQCSDKYR